MLFIYKHTAPFYSIKFVILYLIVQGLFTSLCDANAQSSYKLIKKKLLKPVTAAAIDKKKHLYIADTEGNITQYDSLGHQLLTYSPEKIGTVTSMTTSQTMRLFIFYRDFQEYVILNRFLDQTSRQKFVQEEVGFVKLATLSSDNNIWIFDDTEVSIKKYSPQLNKVITKTSLDLMFNNQSQEVTSLQEYENLLYLVDQKSGILIFDNLGNFKKKLAYTGVTGLTVFDRKMYIIHNQQLKCINLYNTNSKSSSIIINNLSIEAKTQISYPFITSTLLFWITPSNFLVYRR